MSRLRVFALLCVALIAPETAWAHAILVSSNPVAGGTVTGPDITLTLHFNSRIDQKRSTLNLTDAAGKTDALVLTPDVPADTIAATTTLISGAYTLRWQILSTDGHITRGDVPFTVTALPAADSR